MSVDDYLDLLNYAKAINDGQWQEEIIESLKNLKASTPLEKDEQSVRELWSRFDDVNASLLDLFNKLRENEGSGEQSRWKEEIWELKLERVKLSNKIQKKYIRTI
ncbi:hypothetical protein [Paenibacillus donghaensis]|uniref:Uncharacterized protein n=1 Tax=Paenibacillus donghaensis TaxID=414771 RepID=A0A2Z2KRZ9_9BACL|nr:hypothetical protein [Paenibacillus donghaensis]ASA23301.1 hypothetical protein B9T62_22335 [Paenibacillus donghaensis]